METITAEVRDTLGVPVVDSLEDLVERTDLALVTAADPRSHPGLFARIAPAGKPVFVTKLLCADASSANAMAELADHHQVPLLCASPHRFTSALVHAVAADRSDTTGADVHGRMPPEPPLPPVFWYGAHLADMLYAVLGPGCRQVTTVGGGNGGDTVVVGAWSDGRIGVLRGSPNWPYTWTVRIHRDGHTEMVDPLDGPEPRHSGVLKQVLAMGRTGVSPVALAEMVEVVRFMEAAEQSRVSGSAVAL